MMIRIALIAGMIQLAAAPAGAVTCSDAGGVRFEPGVNLEEHRLEVRGCALLRVMLFVKAYAGAFYLPPELPSDQALAPVPKHLVLEYFHAIDGADLGSATRRKIADNVSAQQLHDLGDRIERLAGLYRDVSPGDRYALAFVPGQGTTLALNGVALGTIPGDDFARAVFSIWLGERPIDRGFKRALLGAP